MALFFVFLIWVTILSVAVIVAYDERSTSAYITLLVLALVFLLIVFLAIFDPILIGA